MSKVDAQRAMRQARYAAHQESRAGATAQKTEPPPAPARVAPETPRESDAAVVVTPAPVREQDETVTDERESHLFAAADPAAATPAAGPEGAVELCGHRNIGNKTCSRPAGHPQKSHRYS
jgi:hypothetical protein